MRRRARTEVGVEVGLARLVGEAADKDLLRALRRVARHAAHAAADAGHSAKGGGRRVEAAARAPNPPALNPEGWKPGPPRPPRPGRPGRPPGAPPGRASCSESRGTAGFASTSLPSTTCR